MRHVWLPQLLAILALASLPERAGAQAPGCTYDACALRLHVRAFSTHVVQGTSASRVSHGAFRPSIPVLAAANDSARLNYELYRRQALRAHVLGALGGTAALASAIWYAAEPNPDPAASVLGIVGGVVSLGAGILANHAVDHLHLAIWHYNRTLVASPR